MSKYDKRLGGKIMENQELRQQYENYCKELKEKITDLKLENERLQRENELWKIYKEPKRDLELEIARLEDKLEFASDQADLFSRVLKEAYGWIENILDGIEDNYVFDGVRHNLKELKNSIPESALRRAE